MEADTISLDTRRMAGRNQSIHMLSLFHTYVLEQAAFVVSMLCSKIPPWCHQSFNSPRIPSGQGLSSSTVIFKLAWDLALPHPDHISSLALTSHTAERRFGQLSYQHKKMQYPHSPSRAAGRKLRYPLKLDKYFNVRLVTRVSCQVGRGKLMYSPGGSWGCIWLKT